MKSSKNIKTEKRLRLKKKIRMRIAGSATRPRLAIFRSNKFIYAQAVDDGAEKTVVAASDISMEKGTKVARAEHVGKAMADLLKAKGINKVVFDRGGFKYAGRVKILADAARKAGLEF